ncbi:two-component system response regulator [Allomuricauda sp. SCSIO 65647]|uniref:response regulator n=1 Tax=Allomuricauda sp. SCSIO 65647 TaxID=2908843 RepID=UPI001F2F7EE9|nr:response regulator [Muricauda sp. SCSIO 65647]UJH68096.1 response regulator [Muricauda sp. SCSIO 65647]
MKKIDSIYIVDDDPITVFGISKMLGIVVECNDITTFNNGKEALDDFIKRWDSNKKLPDVIFLDINMPIMDGWGFLDEFLKLEVSKKIRINIITSSIDPVDYEKWLRYKQTTHHFIDYKNKPVFKIEEQDIDHIDMAS